MASLRFTYNGDRRMERGRVLMPPFLPRCIRPLEYSRLTPITYAAKPTKENQELKTENQEPVSGAEPITTLPVAYPDQNDSAEKEQENTAPVNVSELLVNRLDILEAGLNKTSSQVDQAKIVLDDVIFKLDSFLQILQILYANEEKRLQGPQLQAAPSQKTTKDAVDELLELLQTPAIQGVLRQFLISIIVKK